MRVPNDLRLAREVPELHVILGGHDHHYEQQTVSRAATPPPTFDLYSPDHQSQVGDVLMLKSGSEFREFSLVMVTFPDNSLDPTVRPQIDVVHHDVKKEVVPDREMEAIVEKYLNKVSFPYSAKDKRLSV